jgi:hypothetical protein
MRHFLNRRLGPLSVAVPGLTRRLQPPSASFDPVRGARASKRVAPLLGSAPIAKPLTAITAIAETKLNATPLAQREPVLLHEQTPLRRFLDMELRLW